MWRVFDISADELIKQHDELIDIHYFNKTYSSHIVHVPKEINFFPEDYERMLNPKLNTYTVQNIAARLLSFEPKNLKILNWNNYSTNQILTIDKYLNELSIAFKCTCINFEQLVRHTCDIFNTICSGQFRDIKGIIIDYININPQQMWATCVAKLVMDLIERLKEPWGKSGHSILSAYTLVELTTHGPICNNSGFVCSDCLFKLKFWCNVCNKHKHKHEHEFAKCIRNNKNSYKCNFCQDTLNPTHEFDSKVKCCLKNGTIIRLNQKKLQKQLYNKYGGPYNLTRISAYHKTWHCKNEIIIGYNELFSNKNNDFLKIQMCC